MHIGVALPFLNSVKDETNCASMLICVTQCSSKMSKSISHLLKMLLGSYAHECVVLETAFQLYALCTI